jgi:hypothetical protein
MCAGIDWRTDIEVSSGLISVVDGRLKGLSILFTRSETSEKLGTACSVLSAGSSTGPPTVRSCEDCDASDTLAEIGISGTSCMSGKSSRYEMSIFDTVETTPLPSSRPSMSSFSIVLSVASAGTGLR